MSEPLERKREILSLLSSAVFLATALGSTTLIGLSVSTLAGFPSLFITLTNVTSAPFVYAVLIFTGGASWYLTIPGKSLTGHGAWLSPITLFFSNGLLIYLSLNVGGFSPVSFCYLIISVVLLFSITRYRRALPLP